MATTEQDLYKVLGVERGASDAGLRRAVAAFLGIIAAVYLVGELLALK